MPLVYEYGMLSTNITILFVMMISHLLLNPIIVAPKSQKLKTIKPISKNRMAVVSGMMIRFEKRKQKWKLMEI
jgi:hypothetical protein